MSFFAISGSSLLSSLARFLYIYIGSVYIEFFTTAGRTAFTPSVKRVLVLLGLLAAIPCLMAWNHLGMLLDDMLFPLWREAEVKSPLFIVGNARSGTTFLHRLLMEQKQVQAQKQTQQGQVRTEFTSLRTWEICFAVSVTWKLLFWRLWQLDHAALQVLGISTYTHVVAPLEAYLLGSAARANSVHQVGLQQPEEDEWLMAHLGLSQLLMFFFPQAGSMLNALVFFDYYAEAEDEAASAPAEAQGLVLPTHIKRTVFQYYRDCVKRHMYFRQRSAAAQAGDVQLLFLSKNPPFTLRLQSLGQTFPDARLCVMLRDPAESVPSMVSYIGIVWGLFASPAQPYPRTADLINFCKVHYHYPRRVVQQQALSAKGGAAKSVEFAGDANGGAAAKQWPGERAFECRYADLVRSPQSAREQMLRHLYPALSASISSTVQAAASPGAHQGSAGSAGSDKPREAYQSLHRYTVQSVCGMTAKQLSAVLAEADLAIS